MKLTKENIGQKFKVKGWNEGEYFSLLAVTRNGHLLGEDSHGDALRWYNADYDFFTPYEEPKEKMLFSPAINVGKIVAGCEDQKEVCIFQSMMSSSLNDLPNVPGKINWPARIVIKNAKFNIGDSHDLGDITGDLFFEVEK